MEEKFSTDHYSRDPSKDFCASFRQKSTICGDFISTFALSVSPTLLYGKSRKER